MVRDGLVTVNCIGSGCCDGVASGPAGLADSDLSIGSIRIPALGLNSIFAVVIASAAPPAIAIAKINSDSSSNGRGDVDAHATSAVVIGKVTADICNLTPFSSCTDVLARSLKMSGGSGHLHKGDDLIRPAFK
jgi:hypothetical protein